MLFAISAVLFAALMGLALSWSLLRGMLKLQKAREGKRTLFIIDTADIGFDYYADIIEKWLFNLGFGKYKAGNKGRILKYHISGCIFRCGFNYYQQDSRLIIEAWLNVCGKESPLTFVTYQSNGNSTPIALDQQGKDEYLKVLNTLFTVPEIISDTNNVTLQNNIQVSAFKATQKAERNSTRKLVWGILIFSFALSFLIIFIRTKLGG